MSKGQRKKKEKKEKKRKEEVGPATCCRHPGHAAPCRACAGRRRARTSTLRHGPEQHVIARVFARVSHLTDTCVCFCEYRKEESTNERPPAQTAHTAGQHSTAGQCQACTVAQSTNPQRSTQRIRRKVSSESVAQYTTNP
eukprot:3374400-Rhodomonas_salina.3